MRLCGFNAVYGCGQRDIVFLFIASLCVMEPDFGIFCGAFL